MKDEKKTMINKQNQNKYIHWLISLLIGIVLVMQGCVPKNSDFFSSFGTGDGDTDNEDVIPTAFEIVGSWLFYYVYILDGCNSQTGEFTAEALVVLVDEDGSIIGVAFADAEDELRGPYNRSKTVSYKSNNSLNGTFEGETGKVSIGNGFFAREIWEGNFFFDEANPSAVRYEGTSLVEVTDADDNLACTIEYEVEGERTGPLP